MGAEEAGETTPVLGLVVAAFTPPTAATAVAAATTGTAPPAGFTVGKLPTPARGALALAPSKLGFTVMRAVSFGGAFLMTEVPDFLLPSGVMAGLAAAGFIGITAPLAGATGVMPPGLPGLTGRIAPGLPPGIIGMIGLTAPGALDAGITAVGTFTFGVAAEATAAAAKGIAWDRRGGAIVDLSCGETAAAVRGAGALTKDPGRLPLGLDARGGGTIALDFFFCGGLSESTGAVRADAAGVGGGGTGDTIVGRGGKAGAGSSLLVIGGGGGGTDAVLLTTGAGKAVDGEGLRTLGVGTEGALATGIGEAGAAGDGIATGNTFATGVGEADTTGVGTAATGDVLDIGTEAGAAGMGGASIA